jgi:hypothetical protein
MYFWVVIAENHRAFQDKSRAWLIAIEQVIGLDGPEDPKIPAPGLAGLVTGKGAVQRVRWQLLGFVAVAWVAVGVLQATGNLPSSCDDTKTAPATCVGGQPGRDGAPGRDGRDGVPGRDGRDGPPGKDGQTSVRVVQSTAQSPVCHECCCGEAAKK